MDILIAHTSEVPIYQQIKDQIKDAILAEELMDGDLLPSIRVLANETRVSVLTIRRAYDELEEEGFVVSMPGKGSFVATRNIALLKEAKLRMIEGKLNEAYETAKTVGISKAELYAMMDILFADE